MTSETLYDIVIIGGGVNGCGIARDAAGRGMSVALFEQNDLASGTSSASTKLIHGGLRYLEYYKFRLVREALMEREVLWQIAPHIIWPLRFVLPHQKGLRPRWLVRLGLFLYDYIGGRKLLRATRSLDLRYASAGKPLKSSFKKAFEYSDCWVDDSRLVALNARSAAELGARIETRSRVTAATRQNGQWRVTVENAQTGQGETVLARILVNAAGPWVGEALKTVVKSSTAATVRMVQGSHIVVPKMFDHKRAYIFQNADNRIIFAIPYERNFTLIGTTDKDYTGDPAKVAISAEEITYLCSAASEYFEMPVLPEDVVWTYSGVRPLYDDGATKAQEATRDYVLHLDEEPGAAPLLSVFGGKITTYRRLAEAALDKLAAYVPADSQTRKGWTGKAPLPGGDFPWSNYQHLVYSLRTDRRFVPTTMAQRLVRAYGTEARSIIGNAKSLDDLGRHFGADLYEAEVRHLMDREWARSADDVLWRRSKLGLSVSKEQAAALNDWITLKNSTPRKR